MVPIGCGLTLNGLWPLVSAGWFILNGLSSLISADWVGFGRRSIENNWLFHGGNCPVFPGIYIFLALAFALAILFWRIINFNMPAWWIIIFNIVA